MDLAEINDVSIFAEHVGSLFKIEITPSEFVDAMLIEVEALGTGRRSADSLSRGPFSLLFRLQGNFTLPQETYRVSQEQLGELPLFMVPVGPGQMETIFN